MEIYFNKNNHNYQATTQSIHFPYFDVFTNAKHVSEMFKKTHDELNATQLINRNVFFEKIASIIKYTSQLNKELKSSIDKDLYANVTVDNKNNKMYTYNLISIDIDFNSFIYHTKSALDTFFNYIYDNFGAPTKAKKIVSKEKKKDPSFDNSYFGIFEVYTKSHNDANIQLIGKELVLLKPFLSNIIERGTKSSFRNLLTHASTVNQHTESCFTIFEDIKGNKLFIDSDVYGYPLINTTNMITEVITKFLLTSLCLSINSSLCLQINNYSFVVADDCPFVNFRDYVDANSKDELQIQIFTDNGFILNQEKVHKSELLKNIIKA